MFKKAHPMQAKLKVSLYGPPGSGKTLTTLIWAEFLAAHDKTRIAFIDTERGTDFYAKSIDDRVIHPEAFDFDAIYTRSLSEVLKAVKSIDPKEHGVLVIDSITHLWEAAMAAYEGKMTSSQTGIPMHAWGKIKKPYKELVRFLLDCPIHVFILGRQKNVFETVDGEMVKVGVGMRAEGETEYEPHICARMEARKNQKDKNLSDVLAVFEKDRTGILAGKTFTNPDAKVIAPLLSILGNEQAVSEDPDKVAEDDSELLERETEKKKVKAEKSESQFADFNAAIVGATTLEEMNMIATDLKKAKKSMLEEHVDALRLLYGNKHKSVSEKLAPTGV